MTNREVEHEIVVDAPGERVYQMIAEVENWPVIFPPTVYVDYLARCGDNERIRIWATANGEAKHWTSRRVLDPVAGRIMFRQETPAPPVAAMGGTWIVTPRTETSSHVRLLHNYRAIDDTPAGLEWIDNAVDRNSRAELAALKHNVEVATGTAELALSFTDGIEVDGSAKDMYDFVNEAAAWRERLPHVADVDMRETTPGLQTLRMDTQSKDGSRHTTESVRVCFPNHRIVYKQTTLPALMNLHTGCWRFTEDDSGVTTATSQHTVVINPDTIAGVLGPGSTVDEARTFVRDALGGNSRATLGHAKAYAEARR